MSWSLDITARAVTFTSMGTQQTKLYPAVTALLLTVGYSLPGAAQTPVLPQEAPVDSETIAPLSVTQDAQLNDKLLALRTAPAAQAPRLAREIEREWAKSGSTSLDMLLRRGRKALEDEEIDIAIEHLTALTDHAPDFAEGWHARATAFFLKGLYGPALSDLQKALILNPNNYNALFGLGVMFQEINDDLRAERAFRQVIEIHPNHANASTMLEQLKAKGIGREL
ncbi:MAG: tetratricopeptide repeat protein [Tateyamaria sp.]|uniref:tetratricopeptide repeat protein n=2 Tax=Tateyamaria sp. TaxID=1929288 RepID=UPI00329E5BA7